MSASFIAKTCERFRSGLVKICVTIGAVLIVISVTALVLPFMLGVLFLAMAQRFGRDDLEPATIEVVPVGA